MVMPLRFPKRSLKPTTFWVCHYILYFTINEIVSKGKQMSTPVKIALISIFTSYHTKQEIGDTISVSHSGFFSCSNDIAQADL